MIRLTYRRLRNRLGLTLLSVLAVGLAVGIVISIPVFAKAVTYNVLRQELDAVAASSNRPAFSVRAYVLPGFNYALRLDRVHEWEQRIGETIATETGLPLTSSQRQAETQGLVLRTRDVPTAYGPARTPLLEDTHLAVLPGVEHKMAIVEGRSMDAPAGREGAALDIWMHARTADQLGIRPGERYEITDRQLIVLPVQIAGTWRAADPQDPFWFQSPDLTLRNALFVRESDYRADVEPALSGRLAFASWYLTFDHTYLTAENMHDHAEGLRRGQRIVEQYIPGVQIDSSPLAALDRSLEREARLVALMFAFTVPVIGFLLYFLSLIASIGLRWQQRENAVMAGRGMRGSQLLAISALESTAIIALGAPLGAAGGLQLARALGYAESFMRFAPREPLTVSLSASNVPLLLGTLAALLCARLIPVARTMRATILSHERRRARAPDRPIWQRFYLDVVLLVLVAYAYRQLVAEGTLVPRAEAGAEVIAQDPLLFLVPALSALTASLLMVRAFPLFMRVGDWLSALGQRATLYLAFRQLARQSGQYTGALLLVIASLSLGGFMASLAASLDTWLVDQVYYQVGADVLLRQMLDPEFAEAGLIPPSGAWLLPVQDYLQVPGVVDATRIGMYPASIRYGDQRDVSGTFLAVDRLDLPRVLAFRSDFADEPLGSLMNRLAAREDAVLVSTRLMRDLGLNVGDQVNVRLVLADAGTESIVVQDAFTVAGRYDFFPTVYELGEDGQTAVVGNLEFLFQLVGAPQIHNIWLRIEPEADKRQMIGHVLEMGVFVKRWEEAREAIAAEQAKPERVGIFGTLTVGFLVAALFAGIGFLIYNYASLQERLFRFTILRAVGLALKQIVAQVGVEYALLMAYGVGGGAAIGAGVARLFVPFFQAADQDILRPPSMIPFVAWDDIARISGAFALLLLLAQGVVIATALRRRVFQALRMGDLE